MACKRKKEKKRLACSSLSFITVPVVLKNSNSALNSSYNNNKTIQKYEAMGLILFDQGKV